MTADELQRIVLRLANQAWVRYWLHWNYPGQEPWLMAVTIWMPRDCDIRGDPTKKDLESELLELGFSYNQVSGLYLIERTDDDGTPYTSPM